MALKNPCFNNFLLFFLVLVLGSFASQALSRNLDNALLSMKEKHEQWMAKYGRTYKDQVEKEKRFNIFKANVERIEKFNHESLSNHKLYTLEANKFADLTSEEFKATHTGSKSFPSSQSLITTSFKHENVTDIPQSIDWNAKGAVTPIKDQGQCGCCWAFASVAAVEGLNYIKTGNLISLSEQNLVDCDTYDTGCGGGLMTNVFRFIHENNGILTEDAYPYTSGTSGQQGQCMESNLGGQRVTIDSYENVPQNDENALQQAVSKQPVVVRVDSDGLQLYQGGIYNGDTCGTELNHEIAIIGYGTDENGVDYWLAKNQWGTNWGEQGFVRIQRGLNVCGLATQPAYPI